MRNYDYTEETVNGITTLILADGRRLQVPSGGVGEDGDAGGAGAEDAGEAGDAGGTGEDDVDAGDSEHAGAEDGEGKPRAAADKGEKGTAGYQKRLQAVIKERNAYRDLGTPEALRLMQERIAKYDKHEADLDREAKAAADEATRKAGQPTVSDQNALIDRLLTQRFGEGAVDDFSSFRETRKMEVQRHTREGLDHLASMLEKVGIKAEPATLGKWERHIGTELLADNELRAAFKDPVTQKDALTEAFKRVRTDLVDPALAAVGASKLDAAFRRRALAPGSAGATSAPIQVEKDLKPPKTMTDPIERQRWWDTKVKEAIAEQDAFDGV